MSMLHDRIRATISDFGQTVTYRRLTGVSRDVTGMSRTNTYTDATIKAHCRTFKGGELSGLLQMGDRELRISGEEIDFTPKQHDLVVVSGTTYEVVSVDQRTVSDSTALFIMIIRGLSGTS